MPEGLPPDMPPEQRRIARMRLVAGRRLTGLTVALDGVHDPHNISAVLRSCDGFGVQHVHLIGDEAELSPNRLITRGCQKWLTLHYHSGAKACAEALRGEGFELWTAMPDRDARPLSALEFGRKIALVFGAERAGVSEELRSLCTGAYFIPMAGFSESLNVSVAAAISLYAATLERRRLLGDTTDMTDEEIAALANTWIDAEQARKTHMPPADRR